MLTVAVVLPEVITKDAGVAESTVLSIIVTEPVSAIALPADIDAVLSIVILVLARIVPANVVEDPSVAELPITLNT